MTVPSNTGLMAAIAATRVRIGSGGGGEPPPEDEKPPRRRRDWPTLILEVLVVAAMVFLFAVCAGLLFP